jgi:hypothetical protein
VTLRATLSSRADRPDSRPRGRTGRPRRGRLGHRCDSGHLPRQHRHDVVADAEVGVLAALGYQDVGQFLGQFAGPVVRRFELDDDAADFGWEIASTGNRPMDFTVTRYSLSTALNS